MGQFHQDGNLGLRTSLLCMHEYKLNSNKIAKDIISLIDKYKDVNERQDALKILLNQLDLNTFGMKFKNTKSHKEGMGNTKQKN